MVRILFIGDIVGRSARVFLKENLPEFLQKEKIDFAIANAENAAGGSSLTEKTAREIFLAGIDVLTLGDHTFKKNDVRSVLSTMDVIRPLNYGPSAPGRGVITKVKNLGSKEVNISVVNLQGRIFMQPLDNPFLAVKNILEDLRQQSNIIIVDFHAEATSEKVAMGFFLAGKVSAVLGTHTHIPTADEKILENYTAYITDVGMTGPRESVLGRRKEDVLEKFIANVPVRFNLSENKVVMQGVVMDIDEISGQAQSIKRVSLKNS